MAELLIGTKDADYISIPILQREFPESHDFLDGNWLDCSINFHISAFNGEFECRLRAEEFQTFYDDVCKLDETLIGIAEFSTMEEQVELVLEGDGKGHVAVKGFLMDPRRENRLEYRFNIDQTYLEGLRRELHRLVEHYEVRGR